MPAPEQVAPEPASRSRLQQAAAWSVAALITLAAAISVMLSKDCRRGRRFRYAGARDGEALAAPPRSATAARSRPGSCASGDDRSCCPGRRESPAHQEGITISSSFLGQLLVVRRLLRGEYVAAARRDSQLQRYQVRVRGHLGQTPGPAAPSPTAPRCAGPASLRSGPSHSHGWPPGDGQPVHRAQIPLPRRLRAITVSGGHGRHHAGDRLPVRRSRCRRRRITSMRRRFLTLP